MPIIWIEKVSCTVKTRFSAASYVLDYNTKQNTRAFEEGSLLQTASMALLV